MGRAGMDWHRLILSWSLDDNKWQRLSARKSLLLAAQLPRKMLSRGRPLLCLGASAVRAENPLPEEEHQTVFRSTPAMTRRRTTCPSHRPPAIQISPGRCRRLLPISDRRTSREVALTTTFLSFRLCVDLEYKHKFFYAASTFAPYVMWHDRSTIMGTRYPLLADEVEPWSPKCRMRARDLAYGDALYSTKIGLGCNSLLASSAAS